MSKWRYYTPDGVMDILPDECEYKRKLEGRLREFFSLCGYREIETPGIEFYDVYAAGEGFAPQEGLFKFFDQQGRILALRYDGTIPSARVAATLYKDSILPLRLFYIGNMFRYNETGGGKQKEFTQAGIELLGVKTPQADAKIIVTAIESALLLDISDLQISLGDVEFFKGLMEEWNIDEDTAKIFPGLIDGKETVAIEELSNQLGLSQNAKAVLSKMVSSYGTFDLIDEMRGLVNNPKSLQSLDNLSEVLKILEDRGVLKYVSLDLGMLQSLNYYTGIIFKGFTYEIGFPLLSGGRYDKVVGEFGRDISATGFSIGINFVMTALRRQNKLVLKHAPDLVVGYDVNSRKSAFEFTEKMRGEKIKTELDCCGFDKAELKKYADAKGIDRAVFINENGEIEEL